ncbi:MAG: hypothetical protein ACXIT4_06375 [Erythrobacter sp.]
MSLLGEELERRIAILEQSEAEALPERHLPRADTIIMVLLILCSLGAVWIAQGL